MKVTFIAVSLFAAALGARAQFADKWLQDEAYWGDGKAEFNIYEAQEVRYGQPRPSEIVHVLVREPFSERELVKAEPNSKAETYPVIKLNQILHVPTGLYVYQQMHSAFWRASDGALIKASLTSNDSCGNTYKEFRALSGASKIFGGGWRHEWRTYWEGMSAGDETVRAPKDAIFYDELPMRVRTIDFSVGTSGEFEVMLAPSIVNSKKDAVEFLPATVSWTVTPAAPPEAENAEPARATVQVTVRVGDTATADNFIIDRDPPHLLRAWIKADGSNMGLRRSLKIDYWNYNKPGDKERALGTAAQ